MKCQILCSGKNKKNISKCRLLKSLPRMPSVKLKMGSSEVEESAGCQWFNTTEKPIE